MKIPYFLLAVTTLSLSLTACNTPKADNPRLTPSSPHGMGSCPPIKHRAMVITGVKVTKDKPESAGLLKGQTFTVKTLYQVVPNASITSPTKTLAATVLDFFIPPAMALSCATGDRVVNPTVLGQTRVTLNRPIKFEGRTIPANTNLLQLKKRNGSRPDIFVPRLQPNALSTIHIGKDFQFLKGQYAAKFSWKAGQGRIEDNVRFTIR